MQIHGTVHKTRLVTILVVVAVSSALVSQLSIGIRVYASQSSPYESGYNHGCDDARLPESEKYINRPGKGSSFHTEEFMNGYYDGLNSCGGQTASPEDDRGLDEESQASLSSSTSEGIALLLLLFFIGIAILIYKLRKRKLKRRRGFSAEVVRETFKKQNYKCAICKKGINSDFYDKHHKDGDRSNNNPSNCQLLCVACHARMTRGLLKEEIEEKRKHSRWKLALVIIIIFFIVIWALWQVSRG